MAGILAWQGVDPYKQAIEKLSLDKVMASGLLC
jgi:hypothetical protein